jgi:hypothetical protein
MAVPKKRVSRTRKYLRNTNWKKDILQEVVRSFSAAVSLGQNPTRFNRGRFSKLRNRRGGFGQPFGYVFEIVSEEEEAELLMKKIERTAKKQKASPNQPNSPQGSGPESGPLSGDSSGPNDSNPQTPKNPDTPQ